MSDDAIENPGRRRTLSGIAGGVAGAAFAGTAAAQSTGSSSAAQGEGGRPDLRDYPEPPFPVQTQDWPGLAQEMDPVPDHGEETYVGSGRLAGRRALITGGDSGIGRAAAIAYAREGADVAINYLPEEEPDAEQVIALIEEAGRTAVALPGDIRDEGFCQQLVADAVDRLGGLEILVNNAAFQQWAPSIEDITTEQFDRTFKTNVYAMFWITKAAVPHLGEGATIINTSSVVVDAAPEILLDYSATKAAQRTFTRVLAKQLVGRGIRVNAVLPGPFWTPLQVSGGQKPENLETFGADTPIGRPGQPAELAPIYVMLASAEETTYVTGQSFGAVGGTGTP